MPGRSGLDLCALLRSDGRTESIPVILLTGRGQLADKAIGFDSGADDYIVKPFDPDELTQRVISSLSPVRQQRWHRPDSAEVVESPIRPTLALGGGPVRW